MGILIDFLLKNHKRTGYLLVSILAAAILTAAPNMLTVVESAAFKPDQVKAAFIYNLTNFVSLPEEKDDSNSSPYIITILGNRSLARNLKLLTRGESFKGRPFVVKHASNPEEVDSCQILFVDRSYESQLPELLNQLTSRCMLTVGDTDSFLQAGGMVGLISRKKRIQIIVNLEAARSCGISFNSKLLRIATIIENGSVPWRRSP